MCDSSQRRIRQQLSFLCRQFLQEGSLLSRTFSPRKPSRQNCRQSMRSGRTESIRPWLLCGPLWEVAEQRLEIGRSLGLKVVRLIRCPKIVLHDTGDDSSSGYWSPFGACTHSGLAKSSVMSYGKRQTRSPSWLVK